MQELRRGTSSHISYLPVKIEGKCRGLPQTPAVREGSLKTQETRQGGEREAEKVS